MHNYTREDILQLVEEEDVAFIRLQFTDIFGMMKNMAVTVSQLEKALDNRCMFDVSSVEGLSCEEDSDMYLYPDPRTFEIFPWRPQQGKVARLICDVYRPDGTPYEVDPRYVLKKAIAEAAEEGYTMNVGPECEFFLFHTDDDGLPTTLTHEKAGYFDVGPLDLGENARRDMVLTLEDMGFEITSSHHEIAPAQHEIDFRYDEALVTADNLMTFKMVVKTIAKRHGLHATFMPKPRTETYGSGMHINLSLNRNGANAFQSADDKNGLSREGYYFIGGLMKHIKAITCITNPTVNSYKRFVPGYDAPVYIGWSSKTRGPLIRVPSGRGENTRIELRSPDSTANPYLALAVLLMAGSAQTSLKGFLLIGVYTLGFILPFLAAGLFTAQLLGFFRRHMKIVKYTVKIGGVIMILMGVLMFTGKMNDITGYLSTVQNGMDTQSGDEQKDGGADREGTDGETGNGSDSAGSGNETADDPASEVLAPGYDLELKDQFGKVHTLSDYKGKVIFLNFWATWCGPCRNEMPDIQKLYEEYSAQGGDAEVVILGIAGPEIGQEGSSGDIAGFMEENGYTYPVLMDESGEMFDQYGISAFPTTFMIDRDGNVYGYVPGQMTEDIMRSIIEQTLNGE